MALASIFGSFYSLTVLHRARESGRRRRGGGDRLRRGQHQRRLDRSRQVHPGRLGEGDGSSGAGRDRRGRGSAGAGAGAAAAHAVDVVASGAAVGVAAAAVAVARAALAPGGPQAGEAIATRPVVADAQRRRGRHGGDGGGQLYDQQEQRWGCHGCTWWGLRPEI